MAVRESNLDWVILRPSVVFGDGGEFVSFTRKVVPPYLTPLPGDGRTMFQPMWVGDLVPMIADAVTDDAHVGTVRELAGPETLSLAEIAGLIHGSAGRSATVVPVPMALARVGMTAGGAIPGLPFGPDQYRSLKMDLVVEDNDVGAFGVEEDALTTLSTHLRRRDGA